MWAQARLAEQIEEGNAAILEQMREMQAQSLPALLSAVKQAQLELQVTLDNEDADGTPQRYHSKSAEATAAADEAARRVGLAVDAAKKALPPGVDESLAEMLMDLGNRAPAAGSDSDAVSAKLDAMMARMESMQEQFSSIGDKAGI